MVPGVLFAHETDPIQVQSLDNAIYFDLVVEDKIGGVSIALADLGNDGTSEIIIGGGLGSEPRVRVLRQDGSEIGSFLAYAPTLGVGINVVVCDLTGDGYNEIVTAPQRGGGPHVRVFDRFGNAIDDGGFFVYEETFRGGVNLVCGNLLDDERAELVTLPAAGGGPHVRVWSWDNGAYMQENFFAFHATNRAGLIGEINEKKLYLAQQHTSTPTIKTIVIHSQRETEKEQTISIDALGLHSIVINDDELLVSTTNEKIYNLTQDQTIDINSLSGSVALASNGTTILTTAGRKLFTDETDEKRIIVDVSEQRLFAYENGVLSNTFLISSGLNNATPFGNHTVLAKVPEVHYAWYYGEENPNNYDLGWIPYNLRFYPHIYIHYAPWHNNFGHKMSHGCVNVSLQDIQWLYAWAEENISVVVQE